MKHLFNISLITLTFFSFSFFSFSQMGTDFVTKWYFPDGGSNLQFNALTSGDVTFQWYTLSNSNSGTFNQSSLGLVTLAGIQISPGDTLFLYLEPTHLKQFNLSQVNDFQDKLYDVKQWGAVEWVSMASMFSNCINLQITADDQPDLSNVTNMSGMFAGADNFNSDISSWNTSNIVNFSSVFEGANLFNQPLGSWNTSNATNMSSMFKRASAFNQDIDSWNTSSTIRMDEMFKEAVSFNQPLNSWNVSSVDEFYSMFDEASSFNQPLNSWNVSNGTLFFAMFRDASQFNQSLGTWSFASTTTSQYGLVEFLTNSGLDCANYSKTLIDWANNSNLPSGLELGAIGLEFGTNAQVARDFLLNTKGWSIDDEGSTGTTCLLCTPPNLSIIVSETSGNDQDDALICFGETVTLSAIDGESFVWSNGQTSNSIQVAPNVSTTYTVTASNGECSSIESIEVMVSASLEIDLTSDEDFIFTNVNNSTYQWLNCTTNQQITNATNQFYFAPENGSYAVIVTQDGCSDTSECLVISTVGVNELSASFNLYPNPASSSVTIASYQMIEQIVITDLSGKVISIITEKGMNQTIDVSDLSRGMYLVKLSSQGNQITKQFVKE